MPIWRNELGEEESANTKRGGQNTWEEDKKGLCQRDTVLVTLAAAAPLTRIPPEFLLEAPRGGENIRLYLVMKPRPSFTPSVACASSGMY